MEISSYIWTAPKNQTKEHFMLKNVARIYLVERGCQYVGTEIYVYGQNDRSIKKGITDCVGVDKFMEKTFGIEVKVSLSDFRNGYSSRCNYNYVLCPDGLIDESELPSYVGLIYVDMDELQFIINAKEQRLRGCRVAKKSKYHVDACYYYRNGCRSDEYNEEMMFAYTQRLVERINRSNLNELLYHTNYVPMGKVTRGSRCWR